VAARIVTLLAALVVAAIGAALVILYALQADDRARARYDGVEVVVANRDIRQGTTVGEALADTGDGASLRTETVPEEALVRGAWVGSVPAGLEDHVFLTDVYANDQISAAKVGDVAVLSDPLGLEGDPEAQPGSEEAGRAAMVLALPDNQRGSSWLVPGATVAVLVDEPTPPEGVPPRTCVLLPDAEILAVGSQTQAGTGTTDPQGQSGGTAPGGAVAEVPAGFVAVAVDQTRALQLTRAQDGGTLYFVLLPQNGVDPFDVGCYREEDLNTLLAPVVG
jgi:pilus assembly protein CpaB